MIKLYNLLLWIGFLVLACSPPAAHAKARALLVGVTEYPDLKARRLEGPANDLRLMRDMLQRLGVESGHVTELSEQQGPQALPTRANVLASLQALAQVSQPGDWAIVYFSGHGAQVPQSLRTRGAFLESDGLDEVFLPRDTRRWVPARRVVTGAIIDDEFGAAFDRIRSRGAHVWAIFDTCHSGDVMRSAAIPAAEPSEDRPVWRYLSAHELGIPALPATGQTASPVSSMASTSGQYQHRGRQVAWSERTGKSRGTLVAFFASQPDEGAAEELFADPLEVSGQAATRRRFGVFTYYLYRAALGGVRDLSEMARAVEQSYADRPFPTPRFVGTEKAMRWGATGFASPPVLAK